MCKAKIADYEARAAIDPTIPSETWREGQLVTYENNSITAVGPKQCRNTTPTPAQPAAPAPQVTASDVATVFRSIPLPKPVPAMDPALPACVWLGWKNYVYVQPIDNAPITVSLLGIPITIYPHIDSYTWDFGDGSAPLTTTDPGGPYPDGTVTHIYTEVGRYQITVTVTWSADWQAPGHPRSPVPGTAHTSTTAGTAWAHPHKIVLVADPNAPLPTPQHDPDDACYTN